MRVRSTTTIPSSGRRATDGMAPVLAHGARHGTAVPPGRLGLQRRRDSSTLAVVPGAPALPTCPHLPPCPGCPRFGAGGIAPDALRRLRALAADAGLPPPD